MPEHAADAIDAMMGSGPGDRVRRALTDRPGVPRLMEVFQRGVDGRATIIAGAAGAIPPPRQPPATAT